MSIISHILLNLSRHAMCVLGAVDPDPAAGRPLHRHPHRPGPSTVARGLHRLPDHPGHRALLAGLVEHPVLCGTLRPGHHR